MRGERCLIGDVGEGKEGEVEIVTVEEEICKTNSQKNSHFSLLLLFIEHLFFQITNNSLHLYLKN